MTGVRGSGEDADKVGCIDPLEGDAVGFEARLDAASFVRVHRSTIINLARLERTEPAGGGRLLAHMTDGQIVQVSRSGAQALRQFLV